MEILNADEVAAILRIGKHQVYELAKEKKENKNPLPRVRIHSSVRFRRSDVYGWVAGLVKKAA
jgi:excisionase family DNA binding protein